jgi:DNA polymerase-1
MKKLPVLDIIDGHNWMNRAYFSGPKLTSKKGVPTGALKVFISMVDSLIKTRLDDNDECYLAVVFDANKSGTFRSKAYREFLKENAGLLTSMKKTGDLTDAVARDIAKGYKGTRILDMEKTESLRVQIALARELLTARGIVNIQIMGVEADDSVGTLTTIPGARKVVRSSDKDFAQLVTKDIHLVRAQGNLSSRIGPKSCRQTFNVKPKQIVDYLALVGDKEDNVPGVQGVGSATAVKLLAEYGTADKIFKAAAAKKIPGKLGERLSCPNTRKLFEFSRKLVQLKTDVEGIDLRIKTYLLKDVSCFSKELKRLGGKLDMTKTFSH